MTVASRQWFIVSCAGAFALGGCEIGGGTQVLLVVVGVPVLYTVVKTIHERRAQRSRQVPISGSLRGGAPMRASLGNPRHENAAPSPAGVESVATLMERHFTYRPGENVYRKIDSEQDGAVYDGLRLDLIDGKLAAAARLHELDPGWPESVTRADGFNRARYELHDLFFVVDQERARKIVEILAECEPDATRAWIDQIASIQGSPARQRIRTLVRILTCGARLLTHSRLEALSKLQDPSDFYSVEEMGLWVWKTRSVSAEYVRDLAKRLLP
jgi:hypothetical protein